MIFNALTAIMLSLSIMPNCSDTKTNSVGTVMSVVDGDTIDVSIQGVKTRVRLIGVDTPETKHPTYRVGCYGPEASRYVNTLLPKGTKVILRPDKEAKDRYGRMLAYVYIQHNGLFINLDLVRKGFAKPMKFYPNVLHAYEFDKAASKAKEGKVGLWKMCK